MKTNVPKRLERLERATQPGEREPLLDMPLPEFMSHAETVLELEPGTLPRSLEDAQRAGFDNMAGAVASALGLSYEGFKQFINTGKMPL